MKKGLFISIEGVDFCGKTTQFNLLKERLKSEGIKPLYTYEPGGTKFCDKIREIVLNGFEYEIDSLTEAYLYATSRCHLVHNVILPALDRGEVVISDRYVHSSYIYQGYARELGLKRVMNINKEAIEELMPDITIFLVLPEDEIERRRALKENLDRIESLDMSFFKKVKKGYDEVAKKYKSNVIVVDANRTIEEIHEEVYNIIINKIKENK